MSLKKRNQRSFGFHINTTVIPDITYCNGIIFFLFHMDKAKRLRGDAGQLLPNTMLLEPDLRLPPWRSEKKGAALLLSSRPETWEQGNSWYSSSLLLRVLFKESILTILNSHEKKSSIHLWEFKFEGSYKSNCLHFDQTDWDSKISYFSDKTLSVFTYRYAPPCSSWYTIRIAGS